MPEDLVGDVAVRCTTRGPPERVADTGPAGAVPVLVTVGTHPARDLRLTAVDQVVGTIDGRCIEWGRRRGDPWWCGCRDGHGRHPPGDLGQWDLHPLTGQVGGRDAWRTPQPLPEHEQVHRA